MKLHKQRFKHDPANGIYGDCSRTVIACLLDIEPEDVPHEHRETQAGEQFAAQEKFLRERGYARIAIAFPCDDVETILLTADHYSNGMPYILVGKSRTGVNHTVIGQNREIIWDPSLTDAGIVGPCDDGHFWVEWIVRPVDGIESAACVAEATRP